MILSGILAQSDKLAKGWLTVSGDRIERVSLGSAPPHAERIDGIIAPGLCDLQVNGAGGWNVTDGDEAMDVIDRVQLAHGVTNYLPTIITTDSETATKAASAIAERAEDPGSPVAGIHLEGPFISPDFLGVHRPEHVLSPSANEPAYYSHSSVRLVTVAPELPGALELIGGLRGRAVIVSIGHTAASADEAERALGQGAMAVTHLFNAMKSMHHRNPNVPGWALAEKRVSVCVIPDGHHVHPLVLEVVSRTASNRVILVSDASPLTDAPEGSYEMAGVPIHEEQGRVVNDVGDLAGSCLTLDEGLRRWMRFTGSSLRVALPAASERPARLIELPIGLRPGCFADLITLTESGVVERVMRRGRWVA
jgi:N-acetylglucosamine-6-phosphate deacetylase